MEVVDATSLATSLTQRDLEQRYKTLQPEMLVVIVIEDLSPESLTAYFFVKIDETTNRFFSFNSLQNQPPSATHVKKIFPSQTINFTWLKPANDTNSVVSYIHTLWLVEMATLGVPIFQQEVYDTFYSLFNNLDAYIETEYYTRISKLANSPTTTESFWWSEK